MLWENRKQFGNSVFKIKEKISYYKPYTSFLYTDTIDVLKAL
jgi:hypothetical protein